MKFSTLLTLCAATLSFGLPLNNIEPVELVARDPLFGFGGKSSASAPAGQKGPGKIHNFANKAVDSAKNAGSKVKGSSAVQKGSQKIANSKMGTKAANTWHAGSNKVSNSKVADKARQMASSGPGRLVGSAAQKIGAGAQNKWNNFRNPAPAAAPQPAQ